MRLSYSQSPYTNVAPSLAYSTFLGSPAFDQATAIAVDAQDNAYVTGSTFAGGTEDVLLLKITPGGQRGSLWNVYGGSGPDRGQAIAVDGGGNVWAAGTTGSQDLYLTNAVQSTLHGVSDLFVFKVNANGNPIFSTYLGGSGPEPDAQPESVSLAVDSQGNAYVAATTSSTDYPTTPGSFQPKIKDDFAIDQFTYADVVVTKFTPDGKIAYSTYIGGNGTDTAYGIAVDPSGRAWIVGRTSSPDFPLKNPLNGNVASGGQNSFLCRLSANGSTLEYSTFLGLTECRGISLDGTGNIYLTGFTSGGLRTTAGAFQPNPSDNGSSDAYLLKLSPDGSSILFATYLGGNGGDQGLAVAANSAGFAAVTGFAGFTPFKNFPTRFSLQSYQNNSDGFVAKFGPDGTLMYSTYLGGQGGDQGNGIALDAAGNVFVAGSTESSDFPLASALRGDYLNGEGFLTKLADIAASDSPLANPKTFSNFKFTSGGTFGMDLLVPPLFHYYLQHSTDLRTWDLEAAFQPDLDGTFHYSDDFGSGYARKFYRVVVNTNFSSGGGKK